MSLDPAGRLLPARSQRPVLARLERLGQARPRRSRTAHRALAIAGGLALLLAAGCSGGTSGGAVAGTITIAAMPGVEDAPLFLAAAHGYFNDAGLTVRIKSFGSSYADQLAAVESGNAQIAASDYGNILAEQGAVATRGSLRILADGYDAGIGNAEILVRPGSTISSPRQLQSIPIGTPAEEKINLMPAGKPQSLVAIAAVQSIRNYLLTNALTLHWTQMPQQQEISELRSGQLKAALVTQPYVYEAEAGFGAVELMDVFSGETASLPTLGYVSTSSWAKSNPAAVADFQAALERAQAQAAMVGPIQQTLHSQAGLTPAVADMVNLGTYPTVTSGSALARVYKLLSDDVGLTISASAWTTLVGR